MSDDRIEFIVYNRINKVCCQKVFDILSEPSIVCIPSNEGNCFTVASISWIDMDSKLKPPGVKHDHQLSPTIMILHSAIVESKNFDKRQGMKKGRRG